MDYVIAAPGNEPRHRRRLLMSPSFLCSTIWGSAEEDYGCLSHICDKHLCSVLCLDRIHGSWKPTKPSSLSPLQAEGLLQ